MTEGRGKTTEKKWRDSISSYFQNFKIFIKLQCRPNFRIIQNRKQLAIFTCFTKPAGLFKFSK